MISSWIKTIGFVIKSTIIRMNKKGLQKSSYYIICFFCQNFLSYSNPYDDFANIHVSPEQICCSYHYFLIVLDSLDSHHACVFYILYEMPYRLYLSKCHHNVNMEFHKLLLPVALIQLDLLSWVKYA